MPHNTPVPSDPRDPWSSRRHIGSRRRPGGPSRGFAYKPWIAVLVGVAVVGGLGLFTFRGGGTASGDPSPVTADSTQWYRVEPRSFDLTVTESGDLDTAERLEIKSRVDGRPEIIYLVDEGTIAKKDEVLVRLDSDALRTRIEEAILNTEKARSDEVFARRGLDIERSAAGSAEAAARVALALAELELAKWKSGDVPQMKRELNLAHQKAQRLVERTERDYEVSQQLYSRKFISLNDLEDSEIAQLEAIDGLLTAELALSVYDQYTYTTEEQQKVSAVDQARDELKTVIARNESNLARLEADLVSKQQTLAIREDRLQKLEAQLVASEMRAPRDGLVVYATSVGARSWRVDPMAEGRQVRYNESILYLPDMSQMVANISVAEAYEPLVRKGQTVRITVEARPGRVYEGVIDKTTPLAESGGWLNPGQREFTARVLLPTGLGDDLQPAMRCTGEINVGRVEDALAVPIQAVFAEGDRHFCYLPAGGGYVRKQTVTIGRASESLVEITDGLAAGNRVLLRNPQPGELRDESAV